MLTITGRLPENFPAGGRNSQPEISWPSNAFHFTSCGSAKFSAFRPLVSLVVHRSSLAVLMSTEYASSGERAELREKARSWFFMPDEATDDSGGRSWKRQLPALGQVEHVQRAESIFIDRVGNHVPIVREMSAFDVPGMIGQIARLFRGQFDIGDALKLIVAVAGDINPLAVGAEPDGAISDLLTAFW